MLIIYPVIYKEYFFNYTEPLYMKRIEYLMESGGRTSVDFACNFI